MGCATVFLRNPPCVNCNKRDGYMGCSDWERGHFCSEACGERYTKKVRAGMLPGPDDHEAERRESLRLQICVLKYRLRRKTLEVDVVKAYCQQLRAKMVEISDSRVPWGDC